MAMPWNRGHLVGFGGRTITDEEWLVQSKPLYEVVSPITAMLDKLVANTPLPDDGDKILRDALNKLSLIADSLKRSPNPASLKARQAKKNMESAVKSYIKGTKDGLAFYRGITGRFGDIYRSGVGLNKLTGGILGGILYNFVESIKRAQGPMGKATTYFSTHLQEEVKVSKYDYLISRKDWPKLGKDVLTRIADSFDKADDLLFFKFVELSERNNMLKRNYLKLRRIEENTTTLIWMIAVTLERKGAQFIQRYDSSDDMTYLDRAMSLYRSSFVLNENFIPGYLQLSIALAVKGQVEESKKYFGLGKKIYLKMSQSATDLGSYQNAMLKQITPEYIERYERSLNQIYHNQESGAL